MEIAVGKSYNGTKFQIDLMLDDNVWITKFTQSERLYDLFSQIRLQILKEEFA